MLYILSSPHKNGKDLIIKYFQSGHSFMVSNAEHGETTEEKAWKALQYQRLGRCDNTSNVQIYEDGGYQLHLLDLWVKPACSKATRKAEVILAENIWYLPYSTNAL
ncbi:hypothetical protein RRG08_024057 [Elysia crispata]|uniref:Uncharacterized protein n=1 Tax=Elysia crispata TaxID=231223 RepID=A0AAE0ZQP5_9GAST|nr:hypothetical protein RRG08_024057 [Elysia crispata]